MQSGFAVPIFIQIAETLKRRIINNHYYANGFVPTTKELEKEFDASNITIRKALKMLMDKGYIMPKRGIGTQVTGGDEQMVEIEITGDFRKWADIASGRTHKMEVELLGETLAECPNRIYETLSLEPKQKVWRMRRIRKLRGEPVSYIINYGPPDYLNKLPRKELQKNSFIEVFQEVYGVKLVRMKQRVQACVADLDLARMLKVEFGEPLFFVELTYFSEEEKPVEVTNMYYRGDRYAYTATKEI